MKKIKVLMIIALITMLMVPALSLAAQKEITVMTFWSGGVEGQTVDTYVKYFESKYPDIKVNVIKEDNETFRTKSKIAMASGSVDIISLQAGKRVDALAEAGLALDLTAMWNKNGYDKVGYKTTRDLASYNGKVYCVPIQSFLYGVTYNKKVFSELGLTEPKTWDEFLNVCQKIKASGRTVFASGLKDQWPLTFFWDFTLNRVAGKDFVKRLYSGKESWTDPKVLKAAQLLKDLADKGYFLDSAASYDFNAAMKFLVDGSAPMNVGGDWSWNILNDLGMKEQGVDLGVAPLPED